jgi:hypothetical protein
MLLGFSNALNQGIDLAAKLSFLTYPVVAVLTSILKALYLGSIDVLIFSSSQPTILKELISPGTCLTVVNTLLPISMN